MTISEFAKARIVETLGIEPDAHRRRAARGRRGRVRAEPRAAANLLLYPARGWPHKNHAALFEAFSLLRAEDPALRLVLTGGGLEGLGALPAGRGGARARRLGRVRELYRRGRSRLSEPLRGVRPAAARGDGVGLPSRCVEAGSCPRSAAMLRCSSTLSPEAIAAGVREAFARRDELRDRGIARAREFTMWAACASAHVVAYRFAASSAQLGGATSPSSRRRSNEAARPKATPSRAARTVANTSLRNKWKAGGAVAEGCLRPLTDSRSDGRSTLLIYQPAERFSVVIPTRNRAEMLRSALATCVDQQFETHEILVCDNGEGRDAERVVLYAGSPRVRYLAPPSRSP